MATENKIVMSNNEDDGVIVFRNASKSFTSSVGVLASFIEVPENEIWELQTMRAYNGEGGSRDMQFLLTDGDGTEHACLSNSPLGQQSVPSYGVLSWNGRVTVPSGWRIYAKWFNMEGGSTCNWQFTAKSLTSKKELESVF